MKSKTNLSEIQKILIEYLKSMQVEKGYIIMCGLMLRPDWRAEEMCQWIHDNWRKGISQEQIMEKAEKLSLKDSISRAKKSAEFMVFLMSIFNLYI